MRLAAQAAGPATRWHRASRFYTSASAVGPVDPISIINHTPLPAPPAPSAAPAPEEPPSASMPQRPYWQGRVPQFRELQSDKEVIDVYHQMSLEERRKLSKFTRRKLLAVLDARDYIRYTNRSSFRHPVVRDQRAKVVSVGEEKRSVDEYLQRLYYMMRSLKEDGIPLDEAGFESVLKGASVLGNVELAQRGWDAMENAKIEPTAAHYRYYLAAMVDGCANPNKSEYIRNFASKKDRAPKIHVDLRNRLARILRDMKTNKIEPTVQVAELMLLAYARMQDTEGVATLLEKFWDVKMDGSKGKLIVKQGDKLYPRLETLYAVSTCFGINLQVGKAVHAVDNLSSRYGIPFTDLVAQQLLSWTYLSIGVEKRTLPAEERQMKYDAVEQMFQALKGPPYNIAKHTVESYDFRIRSFAYRGMPTKALSVVRECIKEHDIPTKWEPPSDEEIDDAKYLWLRRVSQLRKWIELIVRVGSQKHTKTYQYNKSMPLEVQKNKPEHQSDYITVQIPNIVKDFIGVLGLKVPYQTVTGFVELRTNTNEPWKVQGAVRENKWRRSPTGIDDLPKHFTMRWAYEERSRYGAAQVGVLDWMDD